MGTRTYGIACGGELKPFPTFNVSTTWLFSPSMPNHFTAEQFAASEALGELRTQKSFVGDTQAWRTYQETC